MGSKSDRKKKQAAVNALLCEIAQEKKLGRKGSLARLDSLRGDLVAFSAMATLEFQEFVRRQIEEPGSLDKTTLQKEGARLLGVSPATTKRYMDTLRGHNGPFAGLGDMVIINPDYVEPAEDDYWLDDDDDDDELPPFVGKKRRSA